MIYYIPLPFLFLIAFLFGMLFDIYLTKKIAIKKYGTTTMNLQYLKDVHNIHDLFTFIEQYYL